MRFKGTEIDIKMIILGTILQKTKTVPGGLKYYRKFHLSNKCSFIMGGKNLSSWESFDKLLSFSIPQFHLKNEASNSASTSQGCYEE